MDFYKVILLSFIVGGGISMNVHASKGTSAVENQQKYDAIIEQGRALIKKEMSKNKGISGLSVALVDSEGVIWSEGFGWASKIEQKALTSDTAMMVGSISKVFTAIAVMQLVEQGKIDLDADFRTYVPEFLIKSHDPEWPAVTVRQMLTHHSGLHDMYHKGAFDNPFDPENMSYVDLPDILSGEFLTLRPGSIFAYSNTSFSLLSVLIEKLSGEVFSKYVENHILTPLGMDHSSFILDTRISSRLAKGFRDYKTELEYSYLRDIGAGSLASTADDMAKFMIALLNNGDKILQPKSLQKMFRQQNMNSPLDGPIQIGLSFFINDLEGKIDARRNISHAGGMDGHQALMVSLPDDDIAMVVMSNSNAAEKLISQLTGDILAATYRVKTGNVLSDIKEPKIISLSQEQMDAYVGYYVTGLDDDSLWRIYTKKDKLMVDLKSATLELVPHEGGLFSLKYKLFGLFTLNLDALKGLKLQGGIVGNQPYFWIRTMGLFLSPIEPVPILQSWKDLVGKYKVDNVNEDSLFKEAKATIEWDKKSGFLLVNGRPIRTINEQYAVYMGQTRGLGSTIKRLPEGSLSHLGLIYTKK